MTFVRRNATAVFYAALMLCVALADVAVGVHINLWVLFLVPVALATWNLGIKTGWTFLGLAVVVLFTEAFVFGHPHSSLLYLVLSYVSKTIAFCVVVVLLGELRKKEVERIYVPPHLPK